jgi:outer membrane protein assembly factor BamA
MKYAWLGCLIWGSLLFAGTQGSDTNVNARYKVETVIVSGNGWSTDIAAERNDKLSSSLRKRISGLIGSKLNPPALDDVAKRLRTEFHARTVTHHVLRGATPEYVKVVFNISERDTHFDVSVPKFLYNARQGWSGAVEGSARNKQNTFTLGLVSDGDELAERYAGVTARYENSSLGSDRVRFRFQFESYHQQWNRATAEQLAPAAPSPVTEVTSAPYRTRQNFEPEVTFVIATPLTVTAGLSFERFQNQYPAPHTEAANAAVGSVRYHNRLEGMGQDQELDAAYSLRAGTGLMDSDFVYARHRFGFRYTFTRGRHVLIDEVSAGLISGRAPLFERYVLGNSSTLRGWNKFDLDPSGGNRVAHNSVEYRYRFFEVFYDTGAIWDSGQAVTQRHGIGAGFRQGAFSLAVAFPVRSGRADPIFMMGMNY